MRHKVSKDTVGNSIKNHKKSEIDIVAQLKCKFHWVTPIEVRKLIKRQKLRRSKRRGDRKHWSELKWNNGPKSFSFTCGKGDHSRAGNMEKDKIALNIF